MSQWDDQFENHSVFQEIRNVREALEAAEPGLSETDSREGQARLGRVVDHLEAMLRAADPELVPSGALDQLASNLSQVSSYLQQFTSSTQATYLDQANTHADALLPLLPQLAPRVTADDVQDVQSAVSSFRRSAGQHLRNVESEVDALTTKSTEVESMLTEQETKIAAQDTRLDNVVSQLQEQFSTAQAQRQTEFSQALEEAKAQIRTSIEGSESTIEIAVNDAKGGLAELLGEAKTASEEALAATNERADAQYKELRDEGEARISQLDQLLEKAVKTVGVIGSTGMAGGYQIAAKEEKRAANIWRLWAVAALIGAIGATIFALAHGLSEGFELDTFFAKAVIAIPFIALASYAARESSRHREQARINRQIELQLASLDAYLVTLPEEGQNRIRAKLADRFFGELYPSPEGEGVPETEAT